MSIIVWPSSVKEKSLLLVYWARLTDKRPNLIFDDYGHSLRSVNTMDQCLSNRRDRTNERTIQTELLLFVSTACKWLLLLLCSRSIHDIHSAMSDLRSISLLLIIIGDWYCLHREESLGEWSSQIQLRYDDPILVRTHLGRWSAVARHWRCG